MRFNTLNIALIAILLILLSVVGFVFASITTASIGNLQIYQGSAEVIRSGKIEPAKTGAGIRTSDTIKTADHSKIAVVLKDSSIVRLDANTEVEVGNIDYQGGKIKDADFKLKLGRFWSKVTPLSPGGNFNIETPTIVASVRGTRFNVTYRPELTSVYVNRRIVEVALKSDESAVQRVNAGTFLRMRNDHLQDDFKEQPKVPTSDLFDEWILFNIQEDEKICRQNPQTPECQDQNLLSTPLSSASLTPVPDSTADYNTPGPSIQSPVRAASTVKPTTAPSVTSSKPTPTPTPKPTPTPTPTKKLVNFTISHDNTQNDCYPTCQFSGWAYFSDNPNKAVDVTKNTTSWSLSQPSNGSISSSGLYTAGKIIGDTVIGKYQNSTANHVIPVQYTIQ